MTALQHQYNMLQEQLEAKKLQDKINSMQQEMMQPMPAPMMQYRPQYSDPTQQRQPQHQFGQHPQQQHMGVWSTPPSSSVDINASQRAGAVLRAPSTGALGQHERTQGASAWPGAATSSGAEQSGSLNGKAVEAEDYAMQLTRAALELDKASPESKYVLLGKGGVLGGRGIYMAAFDMLDKM